MKITVSIDENAVIKSIPIVPPDVSIDYPILTENKESTKYGQIKVIGKEGLATVSWSSFFPVNDYPWAESSDGLELAQWFRDNRRKRKPMRVVIVSNDGREIFNRLMFCETFSISSIDKVGDIHYSISFEQYRKVS